jgi:endonuclease V-like protein UPF0215 family
MNDQNVFLLAALSAARDIVAKHERRSQCTSDQNQVTAEIAQFVSAERHKTVDEVALLLV